MNHLNTSARVTRESNPGCQQTLNPLRYGRLGKLQAGKGLSNTPRSIKQFFLDQTVIVDRSSKQSWFGSKKQRFKHLGDSSFAVFVANEGVGVLKK